MYYVLQIGFALGVAILASLTIKKTSKSLKTTKRKKERARILNMLATDVIQAKTIMACNLQAVKEGRACAISPL
jgi:hypothetical protein